MGKTDTELLKRLRDEPGLSAASTFADEATAEQVIRHAIENNHDAISSWMRRTNEKRFELSYTASSVIGRILEKNSSHGSASKEAVIVLRRTTEGYFVLTAYVR